MLAIYTILHPTDFSEHSENAFRVACSLARDYGARLSLLHVLQLPTMVYSEGIVPPPDFERDRQVAKEKLSAIDMPDESIGVERRVEEGDPADVILRVAQETHADLIVMGTHGRTGLGRLLMGSVAEKVVRKAPCPVLTVRTPFPVASPMPAMAAEAGQAWGI